MPSVGLLLGSAIVLSEMEISIKIGVVHFGFAGTVSVEGFVADRVASARSEVPLSPEPIIFSRLSAHRKLHQNCLINKIAWPPRTAFNV